MRSPRPFLLALLGLLLAAPAASGTDVAERPTCEHDLDLVVTWTGETWVLTSPSDEYPPFEACRGWRVRWTLGETPPGNRDHYLVWIHIAPGAFEADGTLGASTGFAALTATKPVELRVRTDAPPERLEYAALVLNVSRLNPGGLKQLDDDLRRRRYEQARRSDPLTFVQQGSPPQMIIR